MTSMASVNWTDALRVVAEKAMNSDSTSTEEKETIRADLERKTLSIQSLELISNNDSSIDLCSALRGSHLIFPKAKKEEEKPNEELLKRREFLRRRQQAREYNNMVYGSDENPHVTKQLTDGNEYSNMRNQVTISANMIVSIFAMFGIGYIVGRSFTTNENTRIVCGLIGSIGIMIVEMGLFIVRALQMEHAFERAPDDKTLARAELQSGSLLTAKTAVQKIAEYTETTASEAQVKSVGAINKELYVEDEDGFDVLISSLPQEKAKKS